MNNCPPAIYTYPALCRAQTLTADTGESTAQTNEYNNLTTLAKQYCRDMSLIIETETQRTFAPYYAAKTVYFDDAIKAGMFLYDGRKYILELEDDLLSLDSLTWMDDTLTASQYRLVDSGNSANGYPYSRVFFNPSGLSGWGTLFTDAMVITGEWGVQDSDSYAYNDVGVTAEALDASETGVDVADASLYEVYQYIRVDDELMLITDITTSGSPDVLTVERGALGFTAATHDSGATITRWNVVRDVQLLATKMVNYWLKKRNDAGEQLQIVNQNIIIAQFSSEIAAIATRRAKHLMGVP